MRQSGFVRKCLGKLISRVVDSVVMDVFGFQKGLHRFEISDPNRQKGNMPKYMKKHRGIRMVSNIPVFSILYELIK